ncbi:AAA family ATPase [Aeromonas veronii]|uniref:AAA family ATPase n=1 Tax=Aeromonas veronii TaxID=654 RepID=UPI003004C72D
MEIKIDKIFLQDITCIRNVSIKFNDKINFICGSNGIGKTTVLEAISGFFYGPYSNPKIKKRFSSDSGMCIGDFTIGGESGTHQYIVKAFLPNESGSPGLHQLHGLSNNIIFIRTNRELTYQQLKSISLGSDHIGYENTKALSTGIQGDDIKNWFIHRELFSKQERALSPEQLYNLEYAKNIFSIIDSKFEYSHIDATTHDIVIKTPSGDICFEYLSSGFKSCIYLLMGLLKEIEYRFPQEKIKASDFNGIILIDEPECHLHPEWQEKISRILTSAFPNAQFICATHSPHIIQSSNKDEVITLEYSSDNENVVVKDLMTNKYGFQGWTIEEILIDVMGMNDTRSAYYKELKTTFYQSLEDENIALAENTGSKLLEMLHPDSLEKRIIKMDLACLGGGIK